MLEIQVIIEIILLRAGKKYRNTEIPALSYRKNTENTEFSVYRDFRYGMIPYRKIPVR